MLTATQSRFLNIISIQSKSVGSDGIPEETLVIKHPSNEPLSLQEVRHLYWEKRWTHRLVEHVMVDNFTRIYEF